MQNFYLVSVHNSRFTLKVQFEDKLEYIYS